MKRRTKTPPDVDDSMTQQEAVASLAGFNGPNGHGTKLVEEDPAASIRLQISERERQLAEQRALLEEAERKKGAAEAVRHAVLLAARVDGDPAAKERLSEVTAALATSQQDEADLVRIIAGLEAKISDLNADLRAAERRKIEEQIAALAVKRLSRAGKIDDLIEQAVALIAETVADGVEMHNLATMIGSSGHYFDAANAVAGYLHVILAKVLPHDFSSRSDLRLHYDKPLAAIERQLLGGHLERHGIAGPKGEQEAASPPTPTP